MAESITIKALQDASLDAKSLEEVVNGNDAKQVTTRLGETYPSVKKAIKTLFEAGGLPATPFATKALMTASALVDGNYAMVTNDAVNNGLYVKTAGAWVKSEYDPLVQANAYTDEKVKGALTTTVEIAGNTLGEYVKKSNNLLSLTEIEEGYSISASGVKEVNSSFGIHPFIQVTPNEKYLLSSENRYAVRSLAFYDYKKDFVHKSDVFFDEGNKSRIITIPSGAVYIKPIVTLSPYNFRNLPMLVKGETPIPYEPKTNPNLVGVNIDEALPDSLRGLPKNLKALDATGITRFLDKNVELPTNLFDLSTITQSYIYDAAGNFIDSGNTSWFISDFIVVEPLLTYTASNNSPTSLSGGFFKYINHFDANKKFIRRVEMPTSDNNPLSLIIPEGVSYVRLTSFHKLELADRVFEKGSEASGDSSNITRLIGVKLDEGFYENLYEEFRKPYFYDTNFNKTYEITRDLTKYAAIARKTSAEVYADFDTLMAQNSDYITKETLQPSVLGEEISAYTLNPPHFIDGLSRSDLVDTKPTVLIMCGTHGHEHLPVFSAYSLVSELCNEWKQDDILSALRFNVRFIIVPIANPDGWLGNPDVDGLVRGRKNANKVDIARNFPSSYWGAFTDPESSMYAGPSPASEPETQNIVQLLEDNNVDIFYDFHNFKTTVVDGSPATTAWILIHPLANTLRVARTVRKFYSKQTRLMNKQFDNIPISWGAGYTNMFSQGAPMEYAAENGVTLSTTLELNRAVPDFDLSGVINEDYDAVHSKVTFEAFVNYITTCVDEVRYTY